MPVNEGGNAPKGFSYPCCAIVNGLKDGVVFVFSDGTIGLMNARMEEITGLPASGFVGRKISEITGEAGIFTLLTDPSLANTSTFWLKGRLYEISSQPVAMPGGTAGSVTFFHDITERRRLEHEKAELLSTLSHDLKSPLTAILGYSELILEGGMGDLRPEMHEAIFAIDTSGRKLLSMINDFITLSKIEAGFGEQTVAPARIDELAQAVVESYWAKAKLLGKRLEITVEPDLPPVNCDSRHIERVISNLVDNAIKFTGPDGVVQVSVGKVSPEGVPGGAKVHAAHLRLTVRDNGPGIPGEDLPYLFERYWRSKKASPIMGTGLGLAIVRSAVESHQGAVSVESEEGKGAAFHVYLPIT
jgi:signal transduction histidine kinase